MLLDPKSVRTYAIVTSAALAKAVLIGIGYWVGSRLDTAFGTSPLFLLLCVSAGLGLGLYGLLRALKQRDVQ
jgi:F0F1-type ATP synthase assembly protein I